MGKLKIIVLSTLLFCVGCTTLTDVGKVLAKPAAITLISTFLGNNPEWGQVAGLVATIIDNALKSAPPKTDDEIIDEIERLLGSAQPGTQDQRDQFLESLRIEGYADYPERWHAIADGLRGIEK